MSISIYTKTKKSSIEIYNINENIKQLPIKYLSSYTLQLTAEQITELVNNKTIQVEIDTISLIQTKFVKFMTPVGMTIILERVMEENGIACFTTYFIEEDKMYTINLMPLSMTRGVLSMVPLSNSLLTNDSNFITNEVENLTNYYTKTEINSLISSIKDSIILTDPQPYEEVIN